MSEKELVDNLRNALRAMGVPQDALDGLTEREWRSLLRQTMEES